MMLEDSCQSSHPGKEHRLEPLECNIIEEACQALEEGICVIKFLIPQRLFRTAEKSEIPGTEPWRIRGMRKSCHLDAPNFNRRFRGIMNCTIAHVNKHVLRGSLTLALIAACVNALKNCFNKALFVIPLTSRQIS
jgi:hypothetical protein